MNNFKIALSVLAAVSLPCSAASITPEAGMWEQATFISSDGKNWQPALKNSGCLSASEAAAWESQARQQMTSAGCTVDKMSVANGKMSGVVACRNASMAAMDVKEAVMNVQGQYSDKAYSIELSASTVPQSATSGSPVKYFLKWTGQRLGACQAG